MNAVHIRLLLVSALLCAGIFTYLQRALLDIPNSERIFHAYIIGSRAISLSPDAKYVAVGTVDYVKIIDINGKKSARMLALPRTANQIATTRRMGFDPTGRWLASCFSESGGNWIMRIWRTSDWTVATDIYDHGRGHGCRSFAFSNDGEYLIRVFGRPIGFDGPSLEVYETTTWAVASTIQTAPFYPADVRIDPCTSVAWIIGEVRNSAIGSRNTQVPVFGYPPMSDSSVLVSYDIKGGHILKRIPLPFAIGSRSSLSISPKCDTLAIHGIEKSGRINLSTYSVTTNDYKIALDEPSYILHTFNGEVVLEGVDAGKFGYLQAIEERSRRLLFQIQTDAITVDSSKDGRVLAAGFERRVEIYRLN